MKIVICIVISAIVAAIAVIIFVFVLGAHDLVLCGDIPQNTNNQMYVTRVYTYDVDANSTLTQIINTMNANSEGHINASEMAEILSQYQTVVYAPVFTYSMTQEANNTYVLTGSIYNGLDENGEPAETEYSYKNLTLSVGLNFGKILSVENIYPDELGEDEQPAFKERNNVLEPVIINDTEAAFAFTNSNTFRMVFVGKEDLPAEITLVYSFEVGSQNLLNFSGAKNNIMGVTITGGFDDVGRLAPTIAMNRRIVEVQE